MLAFHQDWAYHKKRITLFRLYIICIHVQKIHHLLKLVNVFLYLFHFLALGKATHLNYSGSSSRKLNWRSFFPLTHSGWHHFQLATDSVTQLLQKHVNEGQNNACNSHVSSSWSSWNSSIHVKKCATCWLCSFDPTEPRKCWASWSICDIFTPRHMVRFLHPASPSISILLVKSLKLPLLRVFKRRSPSWHWCGSWGMHRRISAPISSNPSKDSWKVSNKVCDKIWKTSFIIFIWFL